MDANTESWEFELAPYSISAKKELPKAGVKGDVGHFGSVTVERCPLYRPLEKGMETARLSGPAFPETTFRGKRRSARPSLFKAELTLDGQHAELHFNARALRKKDRALGIEYEGREYVYRAEEWGSVKVLTRAGVRISMGPGRHVPPATTFRAGTVTGPVDAVDLAIAIVLEEVDTEVLTLGGAALSSPFALMQHFSDRAE
ncbi:hypothetical protein GCM10010313_75690 [Streptomyces violarus]|uniref:Uncharacterized protein n=1 Tax=Streptomyces violarus TaxID=67380 RepID=A0A7W4ZQ18_9ACTN|nr:MULTISPECIES: hypothetical protein [Streptomyces]MBB3076541.1 hypothetical protein [Streptomyces violarus]WRT99337.1 hypothetical protein VJ737_17290 [Streptomyces sp. CGMCC 4.1772]GHD31825.1 hypothetical protein GCM10010313_75690 [Streptomyces violarus]